MRSPAKFAFLVMFLPGAGVAHLVTDRLVRPPAPIIVQRAAPSIPVTAPIGAGVPSPVGSGAGNVSRPATQGSYGDAAPAYRYSAPPATAYASTPVYPAPARPVAKLKVPDPPQRTAPFSSPAFPPAAPTPALPAGASGAVNGRPVFTPEMPGQCVVCGDIALSWVEVDGRRYGYCRRHGGTPQAGTAAGPSGAAAEPGGRGEAPQCQGITKAGQRCRRKTRDPSGFCPQHRPAR